MWRRGQGLETTRWPWQCSNTETRILGAAIAITIVLVAAYVLLVGAITFADVVVFEPTDDKMRGWRAWSQVIWPLWAVFFSPVCAVLASWCSKLSLRGAAALLGAFLALTLGAIEVAWMTLHLTFIARLGVDGRRFSLLLLLGALLA